MNSGTATDGDIYVTHVLAAPDRRLRRRRPLPGAADRVRPARKPSLSKNPAGSPPTPPALSTSATTGKRNEDPQVRLPGAEHNPLTTADHVANFAKSNIHARWPLGTGPTTGSLFVDQVPSRASVFKLDGSSGGGKRGRTPRGTRRRHGRRRRDHRSRPRHELESQGATTRFDGRGRVIALALGSFRAKRKEWRSTRTDGSALRLPRRQPGARSLRTGGLGTPQIEACGSLA